MFTGVLVIGKYSQIFTWEFQLCSEDSIIFGGGLYLCGISPQISPRSLQFEAGVSLVTSCPGSDFASFSSMGKSRG